MSVNSIRNNQYVCNSTPATSKNIRILGAGNNAKIHTATSTNPLDSGDVLELSHTNKTTGNLKGELSKIKDKQGLIGKIWDGFKNLTHIGASSNKVEDRIKQYENGEISYDEAKAALDKYAKGQEMVVDVVGDMASGIIAVGAFAFAVPTGGGSLAGALALATATGAGTKIAIKGGDAILSGREYTSKDLLYDTATGAINGVLAPVTNGIGASVTKTIGSKMGLTIVKEGTEEVIEQAAKQGIKSVITQQGVDVIGGTFAKRAIATAAGMAVDGAIGGAAENMTRAALNGEDVVEAGVQGAIGGMITAPIIGGGFKVAGRMGRKLAEKVKTSNIAGEASETAAERITRITTGRNGVVRGADELNVDDIAFLYSTRMNTVSEADITSMLGRYSTDADSELARGILAKMGQFADIDGLNSLYDEISEGNIALITSKDSVSLGDIFSYLNNKKALQTDITVQADTIQQGIERAIGQNKTAGLILDASTIDAIRRSTDLQDLIRNNPNVRLILPDGWSNGITMFNHSTSSEISSTLDNLFSETKLLMAQGYSQSDAISEALNGSTIREMKDMGIDGIQIIRNAKAEGITTDAGLSGLFSSKRITAEQIEDILSEYSPERRQYVLEILAQTSKPSSMASLSAQTKKQFLNIQEMASKKGIDLDDVYYLVPTVEEGCGKKSYGMVSTIFRDSNNVSPEKFISDISEIPQGSKSMVVILDDFSGSGKSLIDNYRAITNPEEIIREQVEKMAKKQVEKGTLTEAQKEAWIAARIQTELTGGPSTLIPYNSGLSSFDGEILIAPLASTNGEGSAIVNFAKYTQADDRLTFMPSEEIPLFFSSEYHQSLPLSEQRKFKEILRVSDEFKRYDPIGDKAAKWQSPNDAPGYFGFRGNATSIAFPYMAPNNNNSFYSTMVAPLITFNSAGIKNRWIK